VATFHIPLPSVEQVLNFLGIDELFQILLKRFPVIRKLLDLGQKIVSHFTGTLDAGIKLVASFESELAAFKNFREDFRLKSRVVNLERAITKTRELVQGLFDSWRAVLDIIKNITTKLEIGGVAEIAEAATGIGLPVALVNAIVLIVEVLDTIRNVIDDLQTIIDEITRIRLAIEKADTIFLSQSNKRKSIPLADGGSIRVRLGKLHS
jgi:hypothetical protein